MHSQLSVPAATTRWLSLSGLELCAAQPFPSAPHRRRGAVPDNASPSMSYGPEAELTYDSMSAFAGAHFPGLNPSEHPAPGAIVTIGHSSRYHLPHGAWWSRTVAV